jgi:Na+-driven multidrug efflux pump
MREMGYGKHVMYYGFLTLIVNIILNASLMYGLHMGVRGAAIATIAARVVAAIYITIFMIKTKNKVWFHI